MSSPATTVLSMIRCPVMHSHLVVSWRPSLAKAHTSTPAVPLCNLSVHRRFSTGQGTVPQVTCETFREGTLPFHWEGAAKKQDR